MTGNERLVAEIAAQAGAELQPPLGAQDIVSMCLHHDGSFTVILATGGSMTGCNPDLLDEVSRRGAKATLAAVGQLVPGGKLKPGVTYHRRRAVLAEDIRGTIFTEAGR